LVDDTVWQHGAEREHELFRSVLRTFCGDDAVLDLRDLLVRALGEASDQARSTLLDEVVVLNAAGRRIAATPHRLRRFHQVLRRELERLSGDPGALASALICGLAMPTDYAPGPEHQLDPMLEPIPNITFARDPLAVLGHGYAITSMARPARWREPLLVRFVWATLEDERPGDCLWDAVAERLADPEAEVLPTVEGGDVLVLSPRVVACGWSERTNLEGARGLARGLRDALRRDPTAFPFDTMLVARMPAKRATMHLDTIMTPTSSGQVLVYPRMLLPGAAEQVTAFRVDLEKDQGEEVALSPAGALLDALKDLGLPMDTVSAGGSSVLHQDREQWTDGANLLALRPNLVVGYERNRRSAGALRERGFEVLPATEVGSLSAAEVEEIMADEERKILVALPATELSRARGGPHCLTRDLGRTHSATA
jgi:arginine deiminase